MCKQVEDRKKPRLCVECGTQISKILQWETCHGCWEKRIPKLVPSQTFECIRCGERRPSGGRCKCIKGLPGDLS